METPIENFNRIKAMGETRVLRIHRGTFLKKDPDGRFVTTTDDDPEAIGYLPNTATFIEGESLPMYVPITYFD